MSRFLDSLRDDDALAIAPATTHRDLQRRSRRVAAALGDVRGRSVALGAAPTSEWVSAFLGILRAGGVAVPLPVAHPDGEILHFLDDSRAIAVVADGDFARRSGALAGHRVLDLATLDAEPRALAEPSDGDVALLLYTSGTTGRPKGACLTHANLAAQTEVLRGAWAITDRDRLLHALPLHHLHGLVVALLTTLSAGGAVELLPRFDPSLAWARLAHATTWMAVPTMTHRLVDVFDRATDGERALFSASARQLRLATSGSAALPVTLANRWRAIAGAVPVERFGMTEIGIGASNPLAGERRPGTVGPPLPTVEARIVDEHERDVPAGEAGELWIAGPSVFAGYLNRPAATAEAFAGRYFRTGDTARRSADGYLTLLGRTSVDILKSGGEKVSALEIEEVLRELAGVAEVAVVGLPDERWGDRVTCVIVRAEGHDLDGEAVRAFAKARLAPPKVPREVRFLPALPRNALGKVQKPELSRILLAEAGPRDLRFGPMPSAKSALLAAARYIQQNPKIVLEVAVNAAGAKVTLPLDVLRYFVGKATGAGKKGPKDVKLETDGPALRASMKLDAMGTPLAVAASIRVDSVKLETDELRVALRVKDIDLEVLTDKSETPVAMLIKSRALDVSKPGDIVKFLPKRPAMIVEAEGDRIVLDLMKEPKFANNPKVKRVLELLVPVLGVRSIEARGDAIVMALQPKPEGVPKVIQTIRGRAIGNE